MMETFVLRQRTYLVLEFYVGSIMHHPNIIHVVQKEDKQLLL